MPRKALVIGGGIGGLTATLALQKAGVKVTVFERTPVIMAIGAGITLTQSASRGLYSLGLKEAIVAGSDNPDVEGPDRSGKSKGEQMIDASRRRPTHRDGPDEPPFFQQIHRADLYEILCNAVLANDPDALRLGHEFVRYEQDDQGVVAHFRNGESARGDVLIGADGVRSVVRDEMHGPEAPRFTGQVVYRCLIPIEAVRQYLGAGNSFGFNGPGRHVLRYVIRHGTIVNVVAFVRTDAWTGEGYSEQTTPEELLSYFPGWSEEVLGLFRNAPPEGTAKWALYDRDPVSVWTDDRAVLVGDAAHPMLPFLGLGAAMSIEDGVVLGRALEHEPSAQAALKVYEATRRDRANWVLLQSRRQGEIMQNGQREHMKREDMPSSDPILYDYDPATEPLQSPKPAFAAALAQG